MSGNSKRPVSKRMQLKFSASDESEELTLDEDDLELIYGPVQPAALDEPPELLSNEYIEHYKLVDRALDGHEDAIMEVYKHLSRHLQFGVFLPPPYKEYFALLTSKLLSSKDHEVLPGHDSEKKKGPKEKIYRKILIAQLVIYYAHTKKIRIYKEAIPQVAIKIGLSESAIQTEYESFSKQVKGQSLYHHCFNKNGSGLAKFDENYIEPLVEKIRQDTVTIFDVYPMN